MRVVHQSVANVYIGWDPREVDAYHVACQTLVASSSLPVRITPLVLARLENSGVLTPRTQRLEKGRGLMIHEGRAERRIVTAAQRGTLWDTVSRAPMATEFANSRFAVPLLAQTGFAIFMDCDVVVRGDVRELLAEIDPRNAVSVVKHAALEETALKMDGQIQTTYRRKNWSSVMVFNCDHPSNHRLTREVVNRTPGRDLHRFHWLKDEEIGALPLAWNWLVGVQPCPADWKLAHFTLGGPWLPGWTSREHDDIWLSAATSRTPCNRARDACGDEALGQSR